MTEGNSAKKDIKAGSAKKRNKRTDIYGNSYDRRKGTWTARDAAVAEEGILLDTWLTVERCRVELDILNPPGKRGRPFEYPPSVIQYIDMHKEDGNGSYRRAISRIGTLMGILGLPVPTYSTLHKSLKRFFAGTLGQEVMSEAGEIIRSKGMTESLDPVMLVHTGRLPAYSAPQSIVTSQAELEAQRKMDSEAEGQRRMMETTVIRQCIADDRVRNCAIDGSGEGISGPGIYFEYMWKMNDRRFIKQHALIDVDTQEVLAFAVTQKRPGDSPMLVPIVEGTLDAGVRIGDLYADSAYDSTANWTAMSGRDVNFCPNLSSRFGPKRDLPERNALLKKETQLGKSILHRVTGYNSRWLVEVFFSVLKKLYGDRLRNKRFEMMTIAMRTRYKLYSIHRRLINEALEALEIDRCLTGGTAAQA